MTRTVTIFDVDIPPGVAFLRSLGRAGVPVQVRTANRSAAGRFSRFARNVRSCPPVTRTDDFVSWLAEELRNGRIDLIAPTSDYVAFCAAAAAEKVGIGAATIGHPEPDAVRTCLFKDRFHDAMARVGFPTPPSAIPTTAAEAALVAAELRYPVVLKPRTHAGVGVRRGIVVNHAAGLASMFRAFDIGDGHTNVLNHDPDAAVPLVQHYYELGTMDVVSVSGYMARDGSVRALSHSRKVSQSPRRLGVGTMFEPVGHQPFTAAAVDAVHQLLGTGIFELEVIVDRQSGEYWGVDLNPRGFGQMSLDMALGNDLPVLWYNDVTGAGLRTALPAARSPRFWHDAFGSYVGFAVRFARGPRRHRIAAHGFGRLRTPRVGAMHEWDDPLPGVRFGIQHVRHPRAFVRPFLQDTEIAAPIDGRRLDTGAD